MLKVVVAHCILFWHSVETMARDGVQGKLAPLLYTDMVKIIN